MLTWVDVLLSLLMMVASGVSLFDCHRGLVGVETSFRRKGVNEESNRCV